MVPAFRQPDAPALGSGAYEVVVTGSNRSVLMREKWIVIKD